MSMDVYLIWNLSNSCQISNESFKKFHESQTLAQEKNVRPRFECLHWPNLCQLCPFFSFCPYIYFRKGGSPVPDHVGIGDNERADRAAKDVLEQEVATGHKVGKLDYFQNIKTTGATLETLWWQSYTGC
jgi:hypothetical protein